MVKRFFIIVTLFSIILTHKPALAQSTYPVYIVQPGDSLGGIADLFGIPLNDLISVNGISNPDSISPGQSLQIPGMGQVSGILSFRSVQLFEQLEDVVIKEQVNQDWLITKNNLVSPTQIYTGTELLVLAPEDAVSRQYIFSIDNQSSFFEKCVLSNENPSKLEVVNQVSSASRFVPGISVYSSSPSSNTGNQSVPLVKITPLPLEQGATEVISVTSDQVTQVTGLINGNELHFYENPAGEFFTIQGIHAMAEPGLTDFSLTLQFQDGSTRTISDDILLKAGNFDFEEITVEDPTLIDPTVTEPENDFVKGLVSVFTPEQYWQGTFQSPAVYQYYNSLFGTRRSYNGSGEFTFHTGVDFGGGITLPIYAPAAGKVVFAGPLTVRGNTVFIDHGLGIYSGFFHQNKLLVKTGDFVTQEQQIGEVGNTGRIDGSDNYYGAGAHLHWEIWANGVQVDPLTWLNNQYP